MENTQLNLVFNCQAKWGRHSRPSELLMSKTSALKRERVKLSRQAADRGERRQHKENINMLHNYAITTAAATPFGPSLSLSRRT